ncbi:hypothetical protein [Streptomyces lydicus]|uniref:hypothetical protein n=1 Tax=Streptomyces lydicus TaxID=47763 RepID=UPI0037B1BE7C
MTRQGGAQTVELGRNSRDVLDQARPFTLAAFNDHEWERAEELTPHDPRLAHAVRHRGQGLGLTQILSAAPSSSTVGNWPTAPTARPERSQIRRAAAVTVPR